MAVSVGIELLQEWTVLGMADWKDVLSNALGGVA
jgi:glycopeptide antibiotics resistance protein